MNSYVQLGLVALLPVVFSILLYLLDKKTAFGKIKNIYKQILFGLIFGIIAILGTECGVQVMGLTMNARDAAPVCAGLIFGAPAGIISGVIGGVERFLAAGWGAGEYTKLACSLGTVFAGLFAGWMRVYMFDNKKPSWIYGLLTGIIVETMHMLLLFLTHLEDSTRSFEVVRACAPVMIPAVGVSVMLATMIIGILGKERSLRPRSGEETSITQSFQHKLMICVILAFMVTGAFTYSVQDSAAKVKMDSMLQTAISDVESDVTMASDRELLKTTRRIASEIEKSDAIYSLLLEDIAKRDDVVEIDYINNQGVIWASNIKVNVGFNMHSGEQAAAFLVLLDGSTKEMVQEYQPISRDSGVSRKYAGVAIGSGFVQVAYSARDIHESTAELVVDTVKNRHVGETGFLVVCDEDFNILTDRLGNAGTNLNDSGLGFDTEAVGENVRFRVSNGADEYECMYAVHEGYYIIAAIPEAEAIFSRDSSLYFSIFMEVIIFTALFILVYFLIKSLVVDNIRKINASLSEITGGNLDVTVDVRSNEEFASLSDDINTTVSTLKRYIAEAAARIDKELEFATEIQRSALPSVFPPYPNKTEFEIYASMDPAKEVGGDFYDFYMLGEDKLAFLVADVSGKGIPAAMFMMTAKTLIKSFAETGAEVNDVFTHANAELCANNDAGMFVTAWMGVIDLNTGLVSFANAGHNPPLVRKKDGQFEYLKSRAGFVLGGMDMVKYRKNELQLEPGDTIFIYTDGVTEATNAHTELFGEDRLKITLDSLSGLDVQGICTDAKTQVDGFVGDAPQFDDITMLCLTYHGSNGGNIMKELTVPARLENVDLVTDFVDELIEQTECPRKIIIKLNIAIDELFSNIARYAYGEGEGDATIGVEIDETARVIALTFTDSGIPYNPLKTATPDTGLSAEDREIGGLGIFMVKKSMDEMIYDYKGGKNILKVKKYY